MRSLRTLDRRAGYSLSAFALLFAMVAPGLVPAFASAAALTDRTITLGSASKSATNVDYKVTFTPAATAAGFVVDFCNDSPVFGTTCTPPTGFDTTDVTSSDSVENRGTNGVAVTKALTAATPVTVDLAGIDNPTVANSDTVGFYARIATFSGTGTLTSYAANTTTGVLDNGSVALAITDTIGVSAAVLETMTFCVSASVISAGCTGSLDAPSLVLGDPTTGLTSDEVSEATLYTQISTNAAKGAVINLKSNTTGCGGLKRAGAPSACDIKAATVAAGTLSDAGTDALFGLKLAAGGSIASGTIANAAAYNVSDFRMDYNDTDNDDSSGVTSTYGSELYNTANKPASSANQLVTFGAKMSADTPAGNYSADLSMIATGKY